MSRPPLPLTVIGGYLGAGKTTLVNRLLSGDHGRKLMVMVNDFGAVNIDAALIASAGTDTLELTNGCVCCTMGADLFMAVGDVLDRAERPDHLVIEASGIADPARIANVAKAEPDLVYAGIVTVVDALNFPALAKDAQIAPQLAAQVAVADLVLVTKAETPPPALVATLRNFGAREILPQDADIGPLIWVLEASLPEATPGHARFTRWSVEGGAPRDRATLDALIAARPEALFRVKGFVAMPEGGGVLVQVVGQSVEILPRSEVAETSLVGIGLASRLALEEVDAWWSQPA